MSRREPASKRRGRHPRRGVSRTSRGGAVSQRSARRHRASAEANLKRFRQGSLLAVAIAALLLLLVGDAGPAETTAPADPGAAAPVQIPADEPGAPADTAVPMAARDTAPPDPADDARALVGSVGLFGLALSWALQAPIESFTGWLLNSFRSYYRIGDRILVGEVFGDVARIDFLTTTVFEAGGGDRRVQAAHGGHGDVPQPGSPALEHREFHP